MGALPYKTNRNYMRREPYRANKDIIAVLRVTRGTAFSLALKRKFVLFYLFMGYTILVGIPLEY